jgi:putative transposase
MTEYDVRMEAIKRYLANEKPCDIYKSLNRSKAWFFKWLKRYQEFGEPGLKDQSRRPRNSPNKTKPDMEQRIVNIRKTLAARSTLETFYAPIGADSISWELNKLGIEADKMPSIATINRILKRNGLIKKSVKTQRKSVIPYPSPVVEKPNDVHQLDPVGPRYIKGNNGVERFFSIHLVDCFSKMVVIRQYEDTQNQTLINFLTKEAWPNLGLPKVLQVDNMLSIKGSNRYPRSPGNVIRLCLLFGIEILFIPINEPQRNGVVESLNNTFNKIFYQRQQFTDLVHLKNESAVFERFYCHKRPHSKLNVAKHGSKIPYQVHMNKDFRAFSSNFTLKDFRVKGKLKIPLAEGKISFIRWINKNCQLDIFSEKFPVPEGLKYSYVKATILTKEQCLQIWHENNLVKEFSYYLME